MPEYGFSLNRIFSTKYIIVDCVLRRENVGQTKPVFLHISCSEQSNTTCRRFYFANTTDLYTRNYVENQHGFQCSSIAPFIFQKPEASLLINEILNCPSTQLLPQNSFYYLRKSPKKLVFQSRVACKGVAKACTKLDQIRH